MVTYLQKHERLTADERKRQLIEVAIDLFSQKGFGGTTTKEIAAAAGVNEAIIFRHFATKQQLYAAILDFRIQPGIQESFAGVQASMLADDDAAVFGWLIAKVIDIYREDPRFERLMMYAALEGHEIARMHHNQASPFVEAFRNYVERRQKAGALIECDPFILILAAVGVAKQFAQGKYLFPGKMDCSFGEDAAVSKVLLKVILNGVTVQKKTKGKKK